jgi:hypothetical protein
MTRNTISDSIDLSPDTDCHQIGYQQILDHLGLLANPGTTSEIVSSALEAAQPDRYTDCSDTRFRRTKEVTSTGQTRGPGLLVALIMSLSKHRSPGICMCLAPVIDRCSGSTRGQASLSLPSLCRSYCPESALMSHWIRALSKGFSVDSIRITVHVQEIGLRKLWIS